MNIQQFKYILAVEEHKHFEVAAEYCHVTQSTLSTMISKFEEEIGFKIFDRKKKPVQLSAEGALMIEQMKLAMNHIALLEELSKEIKGEIAGHLSLSVIPTVAPFLLPIFLQDFAQKFPNLQIKVREEPTAEIIRKLKTRELDIGILSTPIHDKDILEYHLYNEPFVYYDALQSGSKKMNAHKIKTEKLCLMEEGHCLRTQILQLCDEHERSIQRTLNFEYKAGSIDSLMRFVKAQKATTLLPFLATTDFNDQEKSHVSEFLSPVPYRSIGLVVHRHFVKKKLLITLQEHIINCVQPLLPKSNLKGEALKPI
jgi:LysR family transcriptional regulator, hydrogen peroxide-inducible genes activator